MFFTFTLIYIQIYFNLLRVGFAFMTQNIKLLLLTFSLFGSLQRKKSTKKKQKKPQQINRPTWHLTGLKKEFYLITKKRKMSVVLFYGFVMHFNIVVSKIDNFFVPC